MFFSSIIPKSPLRASEDRLAMADLMPISSEGSAVAADAARGGLLEPTGEGYDRVGMASWYGGQFHGRQTADGETFDRTELNATPYLHRVAGRAQELPFGDGEFDVALAAEMLEHIPATGREACGCWRRAAG